jgi:hypothetical protein
MFEILLDLLSLRRRSSFYHFIFVLEEKEVNLGNNPKMGYDSCSLFTMLTIESLVRDFR